MSPVTKFSMSKKIISTSSLLQQRPVLFRNKPVSSTSGASPRTTKSVRTETLEANPSQENLVEFPIYYAEEETKEEERMSMQQEEQPVVIPIIDSSKSKNSKKSYPKDISFTEDGDSISFPLDCEIESNEEEPGVKVLIGSLNRVVKTPQIFVTKSGSNVNVKKLKTLTGKKTGEDIQDEEEEEEQQQQQVLLDSREEPKYFSKYFVK